jgi:competence protein ComFC
VNHCLLCGSTYWERLSLARLVVAEREHLCGNCARKLEPVKSGCRKCGKWCGGSEQNCCLDCKLWKAMHKDDPLARNCSLYYYNPFLKELLSAYKYRGDAALAQMFASQLKQAIRREFRCHSLTYVPLSADRLQERGFNQSELLLTASGLPASPVLARVDQAPAKQSKKTRENRIKSYKKNPFCMISRKTSDIAGKDFLVVDDIYTTGTTVRQAAAILLAHGAKSVSSLTVARAK